MQPTITYFISHCHKRQKNGAIATLGEIIRRLGYNIPVIPEGSEPLRLMYHEWEAQIIHTKGSLRATINIYKDVQAIATEDELPYLDVTIRS